MRITNTLRGGIVAALVVARFSHRINCIYNNSGSDCYSMNR